MEARTLDIPEASRVVLLPIDGSEHSDRAFAWYVNDGNLNDNDFLLFVHVVSPVFPTLEVGDMVDIERVDVSKCSSALETGLSDGKRLCDEYEARCRLHNIKCGALAFVDTSAGHAICSVAKKFGAKLIVVGSRGRGVVSRTILGSVSSYIVHHSHIPVAVIPPPKAKKV